MSKSKRKSVNSTSRNNSSPDSEDEAKIGQDAWACSVCTFVNKYEDFKCEMCDTRKGTSTRKPKLNEDLIRQQEQQMQQQNLIYTAAQDKTLRKKASIGGGNSRDYGYDYDGPSTSRLPQSQRDSDSPLNYQLKLPDNLIDREKKKDTIIKVDDVPVIITEFEARSPIPKKKENEEVLKPMKASKDSGKVTVLKLSYDLDYLALGHDSGIINVMKLPVKGNQEKLEQLLIEDIHKDNKVVDIIWSKCGNIIYVGDVSGNVTEIVISWSEKKIEFKFLDINYYPVVAICLNEDENVLCYATSYAVSSLILADKKKPVKKVAMLFGDESANERVFYRALVGVEVRKGANERDVVLACDKEGSVFVFDALLGQLLKEYGLSESENIQSILKVSINSFITYEDRILNCYNYANKEFVLASSWESYELSENINLYNSNNDSEVEEDYKILDIAYDYDSNLVFCLLEPKLILCFSKNKIDLVEANLSFETTLEIINREDGALSLLQSTKKSTKAFIEKNIPEAFAKIKTAADSIKYVEEENTVETVVYAFDEIVMNEVDDRNEKLNCDLVVAPRKRKVGVVQPPSNFLGMHSTIIECAEEDHSPINCIEEEIDDDLMDNLQSLLEGTSIINKADSECASEITEITENCETNNNHNILQISEALQNKSKSAFYFENDSPSSILDYKDTLVKIQPFYLSTPQNSQNSLQPLVLTHHSSQSNRPKQIYQAIGKVTDIWSHDSLQFKIDHMAISKSFFLALSECSQKLLYKALNLNGSQSYGWMEVNNFAETSIYCNDDGSILCKGLQGIFYFTQVEDGHIGKVLSTDDWNVLGYEGPIHSISITNKNVWYITKFGVFVRIALLHENILCPIDFEIDNIECVKMSEDSKFKLIETSENSVWLLLKDEKTIYVRTGLEHCQMGLEWVELETKLPSKIVGLSLYEESAFALSKDGRLFMLTGISLTNPQGDTLSCVACVMGLHSIIASMENNQDNMNLLGGELTEACDTLPSKNSRTGCRVMFKDHMNDLFQAFVSQPESSPEAMCKTLAYC
uniref:RanBP2-type domain-containing protein n=1 Tax=Rhabditophanes sp. KR3021 TaxID=114890 RepID=A0AC35TUW0_9BILA